MSYSATVLARSPVLYLPFTELSGTTFSDLSGNGHTGHALASDVTAGAIGGPIVGQKAVLLNDPAVNFYGLGNAQIGCDTPTTIPYAGGYTGGAFTIELWVMMQISGGTGGPALIVDLSDHSIPTGFNDPALTYEMMAPPLSSGVHEPFGLDQGDDTGRNNASANAPFDAHAFCWHHYAVTWDGTNVRFYLDGTLFGTTAVSMAVVSFVPQQLTLDTAVGMRKYVAHFAIYAAALSSADLAANYAAATPRGDYACFGLPAPYEAVVLADAPVAYWPLTESGTALGDTYEDISGNGYNLTVIGYAAGDLSHIAGPLTGETAPYFPRHIGTGTDGIVAGRWVCDALYGPSAAGLPQSGSPFTLETWVKPVGTINTRFGPVAYGTQGSSSPVGYIGFEFGWDGNDPITHAITPDIWFCFCDYPADGSGPLFDIPFDLSGDWHYVVWTDDGAGTQTLYVDCDVVGTGSTATVPNGYTYTAGDIILVGSAASWNQTTFPFAPQHSLSGDFYFGGIAQVAIYPSALSTTQMRAHYLASGRTCAPARRRPNTLVVVQ